MKACPHARFQPMSVPLTVPVPDADRTGPIGPKRRVQRACQARHKAAGQAGRPGLQLAAEGGLHQQALPPPASRSAMRMRKDSTSSGSSGGNEGSSGRWQRDHLGVLLAEQVVEDELARGSNPAQALLICSMQIMSSSGCAPVLLTM